MSSSTPSAAIPSQVPERIVIKAFEAAMNESLERMDKFYTPLIELEEKRVQTYTNLAAGAIVASLTIFQALGTAKLDGKVWLALTWVAFVLTIVLGLATTYDLLSLRTIKMRVMMRRAEAFSEIPTQWSTEHLDDLATQKVNEMIAKVDEELKRHRENYPRVLTATGISFLLGICFFVVFGLTNLF